MDLRYDHYTLSLFMEHRTELVRPLSQPAIGCSRARSLGQQYMAEQAQLHGFTIGDFRMGSEQGYDDEKPIHRLLVPEFRIARAPVANAQYHLHIQATDAAPPPHWTDGQPPTDKLAHPVVYVSWEDTCAYCEWLSKVTSKKVRLPTEAE